MATHVRPQSMQSDEPPQRRSSLMFKLKEHSKPPTAMDIQARRHNRSSSLSSVISRMLPANRAEKGYTIRPGYQDADTSADGQRAGEPESTWSIGAMKRKTQSWSANKSTALVGHELDSLYNGQGTPLDTYRNRGEQKTAYSTVALDKQHEQKKGGGLRRIFGSMTIGQDRNMNESILGGSSAFPSEGQDFRINSGQEYALPPLEFPSTRIGSFVDKTKFSDEKEITKAQQMYEDKKTRRQQRRNLRESGDFLGVQGANPRTGYWDISDGTSSTEPSQMSEDTRRKLDEHARELAEQRRKYDEAQAKHRSELERVQALKEQKKKSRAASKRLELELMQRRRGKWKLSGNGWSSVAEPDLTPIEQSLAGTPYAEVAPGDRLFPMPSADDPAPYVSSKPLQERDYFGHRVISSPLLKERLSQSSAGSSNTSRQNKIPRKPVGSPPRRKTNDSASTIVHNEIPHFARGHGHTNMEDSQRIQVPSIVEIEAQPQLPQSRQPFLGEAMAQIGAPDLEGRKATAISFQSVLTNQVRIQHQLGQNLMALSQRKHITSLSELLPVSLKDPVTARIPNGLHMLRPPLPIWAPPTIPMTVPDRVSSNISTTTTIGSDHLQHPPAQFDGPNDSINEDQVRIASPTKTSRIPLRAGSQRNRERNGVLKGLSQTLQADIAISSEHHLSPMKCRTARLCQTASPSGEKVELKSIPISISTSRQSPEKGKEDARSAALTAFQNLKHHLALKKAQDQSKGLLTPPKTRKSKPTITKDVGLELKALPHVKEGTESLSPKAFSKTRERKRLAHGDKHETPKRLDDDKLIVRHPEPRAEKAGKQTGKNIKPVSTGGKTASSQALNIPPKPRRTPMSIFQVLCGMVKHVWIFIEPVFDEESDIRKRFEEHRLTWQDISLFMTAAVFMAGMFLLVILSVRVVGIGLQTARSFGMLFRLLTGF